MAFSEAKVACTQVPKVLDSPILYALSWEHEEVQMCKQLQQIWLLKTQSHA